MKYEERIRDIASREKKAEKKRAKRKLKAAKFVAKLAMRSAEVDSEIWFEDARQLVDKLKIDDPEVKTDMMAAIMMVASWETTIAGTLNALQDVKANIEEFKQRLPKFTYRSEEDRWVLDPADMAARQSGEPEAESQSDEST